MCLLVGLGSLAYVAFLSNREKVLDLAEIVLSEAKK